MLIFNLDVPLIELLVIFEFLLAIYIVLMLIGLGRLIKVKKTMARELSELRKMIYLLASHSLIFWVLDQIERGVSEEEIKRKLTLTGYSKEEQERIIKKAIEVLKHKASAHKEVFDAFKS